MRQCVVALHIKTTEQSNSLSGGLRAYGALCSKLGVAKVGKKGALVSKP